MPAKKTVKKAVAKKTALKKGNKLQCRECGMVVTVDEICGCIDTCDLICCDTQMKPKK